MAKMRRGKAKRSEIELDYSELEGVVGPAATPTKAKKKEGSLGFEAQMFLAADKLRKNLEPSDYNQSAARVRSRAL